MSLARSTNYPIVMSREDRLYWCYEFVASTRLNSEPIYQSGYIYSNEEMAKARLIDLYRTEGVGLVARARFGDFLWRGRSIAILIATCTKFVTNDLVLS